VRGAPWRLVPVAFLVALVGAATSGAQGPAQVVPLSDLPQGVADLVVMRSVARVVDEGQRMLVGALLGHDRTTPEEAKLLQEYRAWDELRQTKPGAPVPSLGRLSEWGLTLVDPRSLAVRAGELRQAVERDLCPGLVLIPGSTGAVEQHDMIVYYARNGLGLCGAPVVDWEPTRVGVRSFYNLFAEGNHFKKLDDYLANPDNKPFMRRENLFVSLYFYYLELAFEARSVDLPRKELLGRRGLLWQRFPELDQVNEILTLLVRLRLA